MKQFTNNVMSKQEYRNKKNAQKQTQKNKPRKK